MSISPLFCIGAYVNQEDLTSTFVKRGIMFLGWSKADAPELHDILKKVPAGSLVAIKSFTPNGGLTIKALGIISKSELFQDLEYGPCRKVKWLWEGEHSFGPTKDKMHSIRTGALYYEINSSIIESVIELIK